MRHALFAISRYGSTQRGMGSVPIRSNVRAKQFALRRSSQSWLLQVRFVTSMRHSVEMTTTFRATATSRPNIPTTSIHPSTVERFVKLFACNQGYKKLKRYHAVKYLSVPVHLVRLIATLTILLCGSSVFAQGTVQERAACGNDFKKFCCHAQGGMAAASCLQAHRNHLHGSCQRVLKAHGM